MQVLCVNPATLAGGTADLHPYVPVTLPAGAAATQPGYVGYPDQVKGTCTSNPTATWLQIDHPTTGPTGQIIQDTAGPAWGLHRLDMNRRRAS